MLHVLHLVVALMLTIGHDTKGSATTDATVAKAIESFQPFWKPPVHALDGVTVVIDPIGGGADSASERTCEDNNVLTAQYLWHFVRKAGGKAIVGRLGDGPADLDQSGSVTPLEFAREPSRTAYLAIQFDRHAKNSTYSFAKADASGSGHNALVDTMIDPNAFDFVTVEQSDSIRGELAKGKTAINQFAAMTPSVCKIVIPCPEKGNRREQRDRAVCRGAAQQLCVGLIRSFANVVKKPESESKRDSLPEGFDRVGASRARSAARRIGPMGSFRTIRSIGLWEMYKRTAYPIRVSAISMFHQAERKRYVLEGAATSRKWQTGCFSRQNEVGVEQVQNNVRALPDSKKLDNELRGVHGWHGPLVRSAR
ncbi:MAG: hypothetical protein R3E58_13785 [Phycisphaerae bacterium]